MTVGFRVVEVGIASSVQDAGRAGYSHLGLGRSGIADQASAASLNRSVGNAETTPVLETAGGLVVECLSRSTVAASGWTAPRVVAVGERIRIDPAPGQQWGYLAVAAGLRGVPVLGSLSADTMAAITAISVSGGVHLEIGETRVPTLPALIALPPHRHALTVIPGPHLDRFGPTALQLLTSTQWTVENNSRVGVRLAGGNIELADGSASAASEPMVVGALQVPPNGSPIILGRDHPVTGGYPVLAVVDDASMSQALGAAIGTTLSFRLG